MQTSTPQLFRVEYEHDGRVWATVIEADDREHAMTIFRRDNPHVELRACDGDEPVASNAHLTGPKQPGKGSP